MLSRMLRATIALLVVAAFALFVWPTRWRYDHMTIDGDTYPVRIHRISGHADVLLPGDGWTPAEEVTDMNQGGEEQPQRNRS